MSQPAVLVQAVLAQQLASALYRGGLHRTQLLGCRNWQCISSWYPSGLLMMSQHLHPTALLLLLLLALRMGHGVLLLSL
jgi:hypothetical protein